MANLSYYPALNYVRLDLHGCKGAAAANAVRRVLSESPRRGVRFAEVVFGIDSLRPVVESALLEEPLHSSIEDVQPVLLSNGRVSRARAPEEATALLLRFRRTEAPKRDYLPGFRYGHGQRVNAVKLTEVSLKPEIESSLLSDLVVHL